MKQDVNMVVKGLECCLQVGIPNCKECPYDSICYHDEPCKTLLFHASIVIHEQRAEIDELIKEASGYAELLIKNGIIKDGEQE